MLDLHLQEINSDYEAKRFHDVTLQHLEIVKARPNLFNDWLKSKGKLGGQHKIPRLSNRYQGEILLIEKYNPARTFAALYFDGAIKQFYIKRFTFPESNNSPAFFVPEGKGNYLADFSSDRHPQFMVTFTGRQEHREPEKFDAEEFIAVKGVSAKGNRCHRYDVLKVEFIEPLVKPGDEDGKDEEASWKIRIR